MKKLLLSLPDELMAELDKVSNKSEFARQAIKQALTGETNKPNIDLSNYPTFSDVERMIESKLRVQPSNTFVPQPPNPLTGYPCCQKNNPCKHWVYDALDESYTNSITNKKRTLVEEIDLADL
jgi:hypothetical protein